MSRVRLMIRDQCWSALWRAATLAAHPFLWSAMQVSRLMARLGRCHLEARVALLMSMSHHEGD